MMLKCHPISFALAAVISIFTVLLSSSSWTRITTTADAFNVSPSSSSSSVVVGVRNTFYCRDGRVSSILSATTKTIISSSSSSSSSNINKNRNNNNDDDFKNKKKKQHQQYTCNNDAVIIVLGGSGFIGRRVCKELVLSSLPSNSNSKSNSDEKVITPTTKTKVISVSRSGKPSSYYLDNDNDIDNWSNQVEWIQHDLLAPLNDDTADNITVKEEGQGQPLLPLPSNNNNNDNTPSLLLEKIQVALLSLQPPSSSSSSTAAAAAAKDKEEDNIIIDLTIIGCIGDLKPSSEWMGFFGLGFNNKNLFHQNGVLEGPIDGYVDGKRFAEHKFVETLRLSSFVYGGTRFPLFVTKTYVKANQALRSLSSYSSEDWVEELLFSSSPIDVNSVAKITTMAAQGAIPRCIVNNGGQPRKQGFFNSKGKPILYDDLLFIDGTKEIENIVLNKNNNKNKFGNDIEEKMVKPPSSSSPSSSSSSPHIISPPPKPLWEGALIGKRPYLYPIPVVTVLLLFFWSVVTEQFVTY
ncbi:hypothetical protein FRACYDRAFT_249351 [Fragilariopsis cylindrus CCMP1102]|uniref:NAD(P)-binding domain-containing protein n=1 Tax=Fragilariopsis cylindrus CCMP1102 TaxID=635003 RepID=A0A1E7ET38_9STRA|nr:hypothetical protein FRACYDRAFT_249351 [Fragilariopsis cylindrus CCMP1102]|eukprot:OEU09007.1 hypothetical protein FRACYDRAFT_249351 [Fragilariopsis cylindrus CCMP1102]